MATKRPSTTAGAKPAKEMSTTSTAGSTKSSKESSDPAVADATKEQAATPPSEPPKPPVKTMAVREYLGKIDPFLLQGLETMVVERPANAVEYMALYLKDNDPDKKPPQFPSYGPPPPKSSCCRRPGPPLPVTSCGCFKEVGWSPPEEFFAPIRAPVLPEESFTTVELVEAINELPLS